jgi:hypothetical protein
LSFPDYAQTTSYVVLVTCYLVLCFDKEGVGSPAFESLSGQKHCRH